MLIDYCCMIAELVASHNYNLDIDVNGTYKSETGN